MVRRKITASEKTKELFQPFFDLRSYLKGDIEENEYIRLVGLCMSSFGKGKLSVNRAMQTNKGILTFIWEIDHNLLLSVFLKMYGNKITKPRLDKYLDFVTSQSQFTKDLNPLLNFYNFYFKNDLNKAYEYLIKNYEMDSNYPESGLNRIRIFLEGLILKGVVKPEKNKKRGRL